MTLAPNIGSDRSWVWNVAADVSEGEPTQETLAIRFANAESTFLSSLLFSSRAPSVGFLTCLDSLSRLDAGLFKDAFNQAAEDNKSGASTEAPAAETVAASESFVQPTQIDGWDSLFGSDLRVFVW